MKKRWLAFILASAAVSCAVTAAPAVYAEDETGAVLEYEDLQYQIAEDGHIVITNCYQNATICNVPAEIYGSPVTEIADSAFSECYFLEQLTLPESIEVIGRQAFSACTALESIYMPLEAVSIGAGAFDGCSSLTTVVLPGGITELPEALFYECTSLDTVVIGEGTEVLGSEIFYGCTSLTAVQMPESLTSIGEYAFQGCSSLGIVNLPRNMVNLGGYVFQDCPSLTNIEVHEDNEMFCDKDGVLFTKDGVTLVRYPEAIENTSYTVPDGCTQLANGCFVDAVHLTNVDLNDATVYGMDIFFRCTGLKEITFPEGTTNIGAYMMGYCSSLESVTFPSTLKTIGDFAFYTCAALEEVTIPEGTETIGAYSFFNCIGMKTLSLPDSITTVDEGAMGYFAESEATEPEKISGFTVEYNNNKAIYDFVKEYDLEGTGTYSGVIWRWVAVIGGIVLLAGVIVLIVILRKRAMTIRPVKGGRTGSASKRPDTNKKGKSK